MGKQLVETLIDVYAWGLMCQARRTKTLLGWQTFDK